METDEHPTGDMAIADICWRVNELLRELEENSYQFERAELASWCLSKSGIGEEVLKNLDELLSQREKINAALLEVVDEAAQNWGVKITRIEIKDITPPQDLVDSMARQMKAERDKRATILEASGEREAEILRAEGLKQAQILDAEGDKEAAFREAEARERLAEAEANATRMVSEAIAAGDLNAINYFVAEKYTEALKQIGMAENQKLVVLPMEATSLIGSLAGITEVAKGIKGSDKGQS